ncbi:transposase [Terriglobus sp. RCC_193]|uniref:transposase n=1 Tax=Terriglobus sp. RCC_193 TaxID=3239218 RepID=UPI0035246156
MSFQTAERIPLFRNERWFFLLLNTLQRYSDEFLLHDYVIMEDHVHLLLTPAGPLERTLQLIKGGFSFQAKRQFQWKADIWQRGFTDHRIRDDQDYETHLRYIRQNLNSLREALRTQRGRSRDSSAFALSPMPQRLKPLMNDSEDGPAEAGPLQSSLSPVYPAQNSL